MLSYLFGHILDRPLSPLARKVPFSPNTLTLTGLIITAVAALVLSRNLFLGGILIIAGALFDLFDGIVARAQSRESKFGAFLDSVLDRYSDAFLLTGLSWYFFRDGSMQGVFLSMGTLAGSLIISYAKARAGALGKKCDAGIMERPERIILLSAGALTGWILPVMWALLVLTHITVLQRVFQAWKAMEG